jgi:NAD(P)-dependent dehydrogenase (short-subunit alcohol dehydrogenase family)
MNPMFNLNDKIIVITGGNGNLGTEFTTALLQQGARVVSVDLHTKTSFPASERYLHLQGDVTNRADMESVLTQIKATWGQVPFGLINNAALDSPPDAPLEENGPFETYPETSWDKVMTVNTKGTLIPCQVFGAAMAAVGEGSIINISSLYGLISPDQRIYEYRHKKGQKFYKPVAYSASKSAILNLTRYLATYWGANNVRVNTLTFGGVYAGQDKEFVAEYSARVPLGRMAKRGEYNGVIVFLLSEAASYMTGANMVIDGGWTAW